MDDATEDKGLEQPEGGEPDYKALFEREREHSRKWERNAKANKAAADELEQLKAANMTEAEKLQRELEEYKAKAEAYEREKSRAEWAKDAAAKTGVPADLLSLIAADTAEELMERAESLKETYGAKDEPRQTVPVVLGDGKHAERGAGETGDFIRDQFMKMRR